MVQLIQNKKQHIQLIFGMTSTRKNCHIFNQKVFKYVILNYIVTSCFFLICTKNSMWLPSKSIHLLIQWKVENGLQLKATFKILLELTNFSNWLFFNTLIRNMMLWNVMPTIKWCGYITSCFFDYLVILFLGWMKTYQLRWMKHCAHSQLCVSS
jgi:hypothetical protein